MCKRVEKFRRRALDIQTGPMGGCPKGLKHLKELRNLPYFSELPVTPILKNMKSLMGIKNKEFNWYKE